MFGDSHVKRYQSFLSRKIVSPFYRCSCLYQWPHGRSYSAGCNRPSQVDDTLRRRLEKRIYTPPSTRKCIEYHNYIRIRNAPRAQSSAGLSLKSVMQSNTTWKSVHHLPTHGYQLFLVSSPTFCGVSCTSKSVHTFYAILLIDKNHNHPWKIEKSYILLTDTNYCIVAFHPIPPIYVYVSDPSIHPSTE